jgi:hypothetical protein
LPCDGVFAELFNAHNHPKEKPLKDMGILLNRNVKLGQSVHLVAHSFQDLSRDNERYHLSERPLSFRSESQVDHDLRPQLPPRSLMLQYFEPPLSLLPEQL